MASISASHNMKTSVTYSSMGQTSSTRCCSTGRPIMADPLTGSTICSCQLQSGIPAYMSRVPTLPETVYGSAGGLGFPTVSAAEHSSAFLPMFQPERVPDHLKSAPGVMKHPYYMHEHMYPSHPYGAFNFGFDLNGARRKNATRETTSALKAWLHQHQKNPYPTKAEKIMLAVITQMSLTQVSTWFANARRRLKKENKLDGKQIDLDDIDIDDSTPHNRSASSRLSESGSEGSANSTKASVDLSDVSDVEDATFSNKPSKKCVQRLFSPDGRSEVFLDRISSPASDTGAPNIDNNKKAAKKQNLMDHVSNSQTSRDISTSGKLPVNTTRVGAGQPKQKIWSIAEIIS